MLTKDKATAREQIRPVEIFSGIFVSGFLSHQKVTIPP
jgi:hypothetical protein